LLRYKSYQHNYRGIQAERVQIEFMEIQLLVFAAARTISLKAGEGWYLVWYLTASDFNISMKYGITTLHHVRIRRIVLSSHGAFTGLPLDIASIVSTQCRLYGINRSGNSWCIRVHDLQNKRLMNSFVLLPAASMNFRSRQLRFDNNLLHTGQMLDSLSFT